MAGYLFTSEAVSEGHPDKVSDQISDAILDNYMAFDPEAKVACETFVTTGQVVLGGEIKSKIDIDVQTIVRSTINRIGYTKSAYKFDGDSCGILSALHEQSPDINRGVEREDPMNQGAGDQGMMFGYATNETSDYMPISLQLSQMILMEMADIRREGKVMTYLRPDSKSQVTMQYDEKGYPQRIHTIVVSTQHDEFLNSNEFTTQEETDRAMVSQIKEDVQNILFPRLRKRDAFLAKYLDDKYILHVNPTGKFVIGGPHGDTGLTGRKIIVDTYGGKGAHGGGAFSGKDPSKVDRSAAYAARHIAKNLVAAGVSDEVLVQVAYAIGIAEPVSIYVDTYNKKHVDLSDEQISEKVKTLFDLRPKAIEECLKLRTPMYEETAAYGHMGRDSVTVKKTFTNRQFGTKTMDVELFTWEKLDCVEKVKAAFNID